MGEEGDGIMANMLGKGEKGRERRGERIWLEFFEVVFFFLLWGFLTTFFLLPASLRLSGSCGSLRQLAFACTITGAFWESEAKAFMGSTTFWRL